MKMTKNTDDRRMTETENREKKLENLVNNQHGQRVGRGWKPSKK